MKWRNGVVCGICVCGLFPFCLQRAVRFDVRLTHNHVTIFGSILRSIILLLLNYIARYSAAREREKNVLHRAKKKTFQTFFHIRAIIYICRRALFSFSTMYRMCVGCVKYSRDVLMKNQLNVVFSSKKLFANSQNVANFQFDEINFFREDLAHQFSPCGMYSRNALCVRNRSHSSYIWPWREHYLSHFFFSFFEALLGVFIYHFFFVSFRARLIMEAISTLWLRLLVCV